MEAGTTTWAWFPFLVGAPIWASLGIVLFAALVWESDRTRSVESLSDRVDRHRLDSDDPAVVCLRAYRIARTRGSMAVGDGITHA